MSYVCHTYASIHYCLVVACWGVGGRGPGLLALVFDVLLSCGILGQM